MSGDAFKRAQAGQPLDISARAYNAMLDAAQGFKNGRHDIRQPGAEQFRQADIVLVQNGSGEDLSRFSVLGIDGVIISPDDNLLEFQNRIALVGVTPVESRHRGRFVILLDPLKSGKIGRAWVDGVCVAKVDIVDEAHEFAEIIDDDATRLRSANTGSARILWPHNSGSSGSGGDDWAIVQLGHHGPAVVRVSWSAEWPHGETLDVMAGAEEIYCRNTFMGAGPGTGWAIYHEGEWLLASVDLHTQPGMDYSVPQFFKHDANGIMQWVGEISCEEEGS